VKKIITIVGARPQIIKSSAISRTIAQEFPDQLREVIVHTGQHYDENMSSIFFSEMQIPRPDYNLQVGSGSHGVQTAKMLEGLEQVFLSEKPDAVIVYGDTNSTVAGALAAAKIHIPLIHIEAGLRSFNKTMPEEINRIACDHMSTLLFTPTGTGLDNLIREGFDSSTKAHASIDSPNVYHCGDIMYDNSLHFSKISDENSTILKDLELAKGEFVLCTVHRDSNTDIRENLESIFKALLNIAESSKMTIVLPLHPRTKNRLNEQLSVELLDKLNTSDSIRIIPPAGFLDIISLEKNARMIITDSGGLQKEAYFFQKPCVILRSQTEWVEIVENGNAQLVGADQLKIEKAFDELLKKKDYTYPSFYGDGKASVFICEKIISDL